MWWDAQTGLGIARQRWKGLPTRMGLNKMGLSKKRKEGRGIKNSPLCGGEEDDVLTDEDVLGLSSGGVSEVVLSLSLFRCVVHK